MSSSAQYPFPALAFHEDEHRKIIELMGYTSNGLINSSRYLNCIEGSSSIIFIKSSTEIKSKYMDYLSNLTGKRIMLVQLLIQEQPNKDNEESASAMNWLKQKEPSSVVFVSLGSEYFFSREEVHKIAGVLELSGVRFIWVVRFYGGDHPGSLKVALPTGFFERVQDRGFMIENWAPQAWILTYRSIRGFMSHCGWGLSLEAMVFRVPLIAVPMQFDQPLNARLLLEVGVAVEAKMDGEGKHRAEKVGKAIREAMAAERGKAVMQRAEELGRKMRDGADGRIR